MFVIFGFWGVVRCLSFACDRLLVFVGFVFVIVCGFALCDCGWRCSGVVIVLFIYFKLSCIDLFVV